jgi:hypothetical protein
MASKLPLEPTPLRTLQQYHHSMLNTFGDGETLVEAIQRRPGVYGPNPIAFLSLMARRPSLNVGDVEEALINDRSLVRAGAFRKSVFLLATEDYPLYYRAMAESLQSAGMSRLRSAGIDEADLHGYARRLREANLERPESQNNLAEIMFPGRLKRPAQDVEQLLFRKLCDLGVLVRATSKGWKGNQYTYALADTWLEGVDLTSDHPEPARAEVVRRYLRTYGPSRIEDAVWWTGLPFATVRRVLDNMGREVVKYPVDGLGEGLLALRETVDAIRKSQGGDDGRILFLPLWDAYPLGWRDRTRVVDPQFAPWVYDPAGNTTSVIVEGGRVIGLWQFRDGDMITLEFHVFEPYANRLNALRLSAEDHGGALAEVAGAREVRVIERALPRPLAERPVASFLWPLGKEPVFRITEQNYMTPNPMDRRGPSNNVLRSKFLDDDRLVRPVDADPTQRRTRASDRSKDEPEKKAAKKSASKAKKTAKKSASKAKKKTTKKSAAKAAAKKSASKAKKTAKKAAKKAPKKAAKKSAKKAAKKSAKKAAAKKKTAKKSAKKAKKSAKKTAKKSARKTAKKKKRR